MLGFVFLVYFVVNPAPIFHFQKAAGSFGHRGTETQSGERGGGDGRWKMGVGGKAESGSRSKILIRKAGKQEQTQKFDHKTVRKSYCNAVGFSYFS